MIDSYSNKINLLANRPDILNIQELDIENVKDFQDSDVLEKHIKQRIQEMDNFNGIFLPPSLGKSYTATKVIADILKDNSQDTIIIISKSHRLLYQLQENLLEHGLPEDKVKRILGFKRAYQLYPAQDVDGELVDKPESKWTYKEKQVKRDYEEGVRPYWIHNKYGNELEKNEWSEQFEDFEGKAVLIPASYLNHKTGKIEEALDNAKAIFNDEAALQTTQTKLNTDPYKVKKCLERVAEQKPEVWNEALESISSEGFIGKNRLEEMALGQHSVLNRLQKPYKELLKLSVLNRLEPDKLTYQTKNSEPVDTIFPVLGDSIPAKWKVEKVQRLLDKVRYDLYQSVDSDQYRDITTVTGELTNILEAVERAKQGSVRVSEEISRYKSGQTEFKEIETIEDKDRYRKGILEHQGQLKFFIKLKDPELIFNQVFKEGCDLLISEPGIPGDNQAFIEKEAPVYTDLLEESSDTPVLMLDATGSRVMMAGMLMLYAHRRGIELNSKLRYDAEWGVWDGKDSLNALDRFIISELNYIEPYIHASDLIEALNHEEDIVNRIDRPDWESNLLQGRTFNKESSIEQIRPPNAEGKVIIGRRNSNYIKNITDRDNLKFLELMAKQGVNLISYKAEVVEKLREQSRHFDESNTAYFYGSRGLDKFKGEELLIIGTPFPRPDGFKRQMKVWFDQEVDMDKFEFKDGWRRHPDSFIQSIYDEFTLNEMYQIIHRARALMENTKIYVMGSLPPLIREELSIKTTDKVRNIKAVAVQKRADQIIQEHSKDEILEKSDEWIDEVKKELASRIDRIKFQDGELSTDNRYTSGPSIEDVEEVLKENDELFTRNRSEVVKELTSRFSCGRNKITNLIGEMVEMDKLEIVTDRGGLGRPSKKLRMGSRFGS